MYCFLQGTFLGLCWVFVAVCRLFLAAATTLWFWCTGLVAPRHVESSWTRDWTHVPCISRQIPNTSNYRWCGEKERVLFLVQSCHLMRVWLGGSLVHSSAPQILQLLNSTAKVISRSDLLGKDCVQVPSTDIGQWFSNKGIYFPLVTRSMPGTSPEFLWHPCPWYSQCPRLLLKCLFLPPSAGERFTLFFPNGCIWSGRRWNGEMPRVKSGKLSPIKER